MPKVKSILGSGCDGTSFCISNPLDNATFTSIPHRESFDFAQSLNKLPDILEEIFSYLNYYDLEAAGKAYAQWNPLIMNITSKRRKPICFCLRKNICTEVYRTCSLLQSSPAFALLVFDYKSIQLQKYVCVHSEKGHMKRMPIIEFIQQNIIKSGMCPLIALSCKLLLSDICVNDIGMLSGFLLPNIPGVTVTSFNVKNGKVIGIDNPSAWFTENKILGVLIFGMSTSSIALKNLSTLKKLFSSNTSFGFCGGIVKGRKLFNMPNMNLEGNKDMLCVAFSTDSKNKDVNFKTYSVLLEGEESADIEDKLLSFKENISIKKNSLAFRCICISREATVEIEVFQELFPDIPVVGFAGDGEIGWDSMQYEHTPKKLKQDRKILHFCSSIIMIMTWD